MAVTLTIDDLSPFAPNLDEAQAEAMIADALALAARVAPCILDDDFQYEAAAKAVIRGAILRWVESGSGVYRMQQAGPIQLVTDNRQGRKTLFWPTEVDELRALCGLHRQGAAFMIDPTPVYEG